jgi:hypothetical protein
MGRKRSAVPSVVLSVRVPKGLGDLVREHARREGVSVSSWIAERMPHLVERANRGRGERVSARGPRGGRPVGAASLALPLGLPVPAVPWVTPPRPGTGSPANPYGLCPCGSGRKWKFCAKVGQCGKGSG